MNTFDEAVEQVNILTEHGEIGIAPNAVLMILKDLQKKYEPTVYMTVDEKNVILDFKKHWTFTQFVSAIEGNYENNMYFEKVEKTFRKMRIDNGYMIDEDKLMLAWLYPRTIKEVEE